MEIMINVGARRSDACSLGPRNETIIEGQRWLRFTAYKNRDRFTVTIEALMTKELEAALAATKTGHDAYLVTSFGKPFVIDRLGNKMREWCDKAGLPKCSAHGLRKTASVAFAESGASADGGVRLD
ncbi:tyrosine-type recombinase/integrase [Hyphomicrobiales bacterium]